MGILGSFILGMTMVLLAVVLAIFYIVILVFGLGWLGSKIEKYFKKA